MSELTHEVHIDAAYDKRPKYGQHCVDFRFYVRGPKGVVQFVLFTGWLKALIPTPDTDWRELSVHHHAGLHMLTEPMPADLGYHSPLPLYEGQTSMECSLIPGGKCYYDGSSLNASRIFSVMLHEGGDAMWVELEKYYEETFAREPVKEAQS